jgi:hypothetical protein
MMQAQGACLFVQQATRALPAQRCRTGHFRHEFVAQRAQPGNPVGEWHAGIVSEGDVDPASC